MKLLMYYGYANNANTYILGPKNGGNAILIDPGCFEVPLLNLIEENNFYIESVIVTHSHKNHTKGINTIKKVYDSTIYSSKNKIENHKTAMITDNEIRNISGFNVHFFEIHGHSNDSLLFKIENVLFTGDVFNSGYLGQSISNYAHNNMQLEIQKRILSLSGETIVLTGHGPPSTIQAEREINENLFIQSDISL